MFTRALLKSLATTTVFARGEAYYEDGEVGRVKRQDDTFTAKVRGSYTYQTKLELHPAGPRLSCNCPYEFEGICKHLVAFGLAVLDEFGPELRPTETAAVPAPAADTPALDALLSITGTARQLQFLHELLRRNGEVAAQFVQFVNGETAAAEAANNAAAVVNKPAELSADAISTEVYEALSDLVFDEELLEQPPQYRPGHYDAYYDEDTDDLLEQADEAIDEVLQPYTAALVADLRGGQLRPALYRWVGVVEGISAATEPETDDYDLFSYEGYPAHVQECWDRQLTQAESFRLLETTPFAPAELDAALDFLLTRPGVVRNLSDGGKVVQPVLEDLLRSLAQNPQTAARLLPLLSPPADLPTAQLVLHLARTLGRHELWQQTAAQFAEQDFTLAAELLEQLRQRPDRNAFLAQLCRSWNRFEAQLLPYLLLHLTYAEAPELYLPALEMRCRRQRSLDDYRELRGYWTSEQRRRFVDEQVQKTRTASGDPQFAAELLAIENRDAELLPLLRSLDWSYASSVGGILGLAAIRAPHDCLDLVMERTEALLKAGHRDRNLYQRLTDWLTRLKARPELETSVGLFAAHLYAEYSRLMALREELRKAGLVRVIKTGSSYQLIAPNPEADELRALLRDKQPVTEGAKRGRKGKS